MLFAYIFTVWIKLKTEGNNQTLTKFQHIQKVWSIVIITSLIILVFRDFV